ncbi:MAG TPA: SDR family oxidoreductase [Solirubrobacterales bacterium]|nr:SDR family oxidoreductase [Solirubrobacterales bacterium]
MALVTGASSGIGLAIAAMLAEEGHDLTITSRTPAKIERAAAQLAEHGTEINQLAADLADPDEIGRVVVAHRERFDRLDVLVNNAGLGIRGPIGEFSTKHMDLQLALNLRSVMLFYREALDLLRVAGAEHRGALVVNMSSVAGKQGEADLSVYSATKHGVVGFTQAMQRELAGAGIKSCVVCPGFVDTPLADYMKERLPAEEMIRAEDVAESVRWLLHLSPHCVVPEIVLMKPDAEGVLAI